MRIALHHDHIRKNNQILFQKTLLHQETRMSILHLATTAINVQ